MLLFVLYVIYERLEELEGYEVTSKQFLPSRFNREPQ